MFQNLNIFSSLTKNVLSNPLAKDIFARFKAKKAGGCTRNTGRRSRPKHRGQKVPALSFVQPGTNIFRQRKLRVHPGLNVGFGVDFSLYAMRPGKVIVTVEKFDPNWQRNCVYQAYSHRENSDIYKKYYHVIPKPQHNRFNLIDLI